MPNLGVISEVFADHQVLFILICALLLSFIFLFFIPAIFLRRELKKTARGIRSGAKDGPILDLAVIKGLMASPALVHAWDEYRHTLHGQKAPSSVGLLEVQRWRSTSLSGAFFTEQTLINPRLKTEFFKNLPGLLTGLGIIGTFLGLIVGLGEFSVGLNGSTAAGNSAGIAAGTNPLAVTKALGELLGSVRGAFYVSGLAIACAMLVTFFEKAFLQGALNDLEELCGLIDSQFTAGAGEEYLQRLVEAAETSATQAMQMKESLVTDLRQVLSEMTNLQISAMARNNQELSQTITGGLSQALEAPLGRIDEAIRTVKGDQSEAVNKLLTDVLSNFTEKMEAMFGGQIKGMSEMLTQTAATIKETSSRFEELAAKIQTAGSGAADAMGERLQEVLNKLQGQQEELNRQMLTFVNDLKSNIEKVRDDANSATAEHMKNLTETTQALVQQLKDQSKEQDQRNVQAREEQNRGFQSGLAQISETTNGLLQALKEQIAVAGKTTEDNQKNLQTQSAQMLSAQREQITGVATSLESVGVAIKEAVARMEQATVTNLQSLNEGAGRLEGASDRLVGSMDMVGKTTDGLGHATQNVVHAASGLREGLELATQVMRDQQAVRDSFSRMLQDLNAVVENARREAGVTTELVEKLSKAAQSLGQAQTNADQYLEGVTKLLGEVHAHFAQNISRTLREGNTAFNEELARATGLLRDAIGDLGDILSLIPESK